MKVLHVLGELRPSGAETMLIAAEPTWRAAGLHTEVLGTGGSVGEFASSLEAAGIHVHHEQFVRSLGWLRRLHGLLRRVRPDVLHVHTERAAVWISLVGRLAGVPTIVRTVHHVFEYSGVTRIKKMLGRHIMLLVGVRIATNSPSNMANETSKFKYSPIFIPNWINEIEYRSEALIGARQIRRSELGISENALVLISVASCSGYKNHPMILRALASLRDDSVHYIHIGSEEPQHPERDLAASLGLRGQTHFLGKVNRPVEYLRASDLFLMPSREEGFGIAALEALSAGVPAVLGDVPGLRDLRNVVTRGVEWIAPGESELVRCIREFQADPDAFGKPTIDDLRPYTSTVGATAYIRLYERTRTRDRIN